MNAKLNAELLHILQHSLGVNEYGQGSKYRNHFCAGGKDEQKCRELVSMGLMTENKRFPSPLSGGSPVFHVTKEGEAAIEKFSLKPPKLTRSQKRYRRYLDMSDCFESFKHFLHWDMEGGRDDTEAAPDPH